MSQPVENHTFQAEVSQLLDIVIHSLYTDKEIFVRELISNASDALEKLRLKQLTGGDIFENDLPLEINITSDEENKTITISDYGIGMTHEELTENLGTIAHSGTKAFLSALKENKNSQNADVIGQFGVGFYSAFMVADKVEVITHSHDPASNGLKWTSDGKSGYSIEEASDAKRGASVVIHLTDENAEFAKSDRLKSVIERYSNFVGFPVNLNQELVNTVDALWLKNKSDVSDEDYGNFYKFIAKAHEEPTHRMHFSADAPIAINSLLFIPASNPERFGFGQMEPGVSLYCHKVMIDDKPQGLLPDWLRFLRGVIDSEDIPLNISRESMQDSALVQKLNQVITKRFLKFLDKLAKDDAEAYKKFYSLHEAGEMTSLDDYISRAKEDQNEIYYLIAPSRSTIETGPYLEAFKERNLEVAYFTDSVDDYVLETLREYKGKTLVSADRADIELSDDLPKEGAELSEKDLEKLLGWMNDSLSDRVETVEAGQRLVSHPIIALSPKETPNAQVRAMMKAMGEDAPTVKAKLQINSRHPLIHKLDKLRDTKPDTATTVARQLTDNALLAAGLHENPITAASQMNQLIEELIED